MKKLLLILTLTASYMYAGGIWSLIRNSDLETVKTKAYQVEVKGTNIRLYVFKVPNLHMICVSVWGGGGSSHQLECKSYSELDIKE